jgi:hypothetical protein
MEIASRKRLRHHHNVKSRLPTILNALKPTRPSLNRKTGSEPLREERLRV